MAKEFKIYTKTGDDGSTGLVGGTRVKKYHIRLEAYGTIDELNSYLGLVHSFDMEQEVKDLIQFIQHKLFTIGSKLASDERGEKVTSHLSIEKEDIQRLEKSIDRFEENLPELSNFILPVGNQLVGFCHVSRTVCRRAERKIVELSEQEPVSVNIKLFVNRLSDLLFIMARKFAFDNNLKETPWGGK